MAQKGFDENLKFNINDVNEQYGSHSNTGTSKEKETKAMSTASGSILHDHHL